MIDQAVMTQLKTHYPDYHVYGEVIQQDFQPPCFVVMLLSATHTPRLGCRYQKNHSYDIQTYLPTDNPVLQSTLKDLAEELLNALEVIPFAQGLVRGRQMHYEIQEGVLHFFVSYSFFGYHAQETAPAMAELAITKAIKPT